MHCVVINGTGVRGSTYQLKEIFLDELQPEQRTEFYLPADAPDYCVGCKLCFLESETRCPHSDKVQPIWQAMLEADLIVFAYPVYVLRTPGHVKSLLDHLGVHWFAHRPEPVMFRKKAAIITQSASAPNRGAQKDVVTSLQWLGVSEIRKIGFGIGLGWDGVPETKRNEIKSKRRYENSRTAFEGRRFLKKACEQNSI